jgi:hypothetical protein
MSSSRKPILKLDWCSYEAAKYAVKHWHYSRSLPCSKTARLGVWEDDKFIGTVVFAWGANRHLAGEYKLKMTECAELCRVALARHSTPVSRILSIAVKMLKHEMPGIRLIVSYADLNHGHFGKIYQASNWVFVGETGNEAGIVLNGKLTHRRTINSKYGTSTIEWLHKHVDSCAHRVEGKPKFKYLLPLDDEIAERIKLLAQTYPQKRATSETSDTPGVHPGEGRAARTVALQLVGHARLDRSVDTTVST